MEPSWLMARFLMTGILFLLSSNVKNATETSLCESSSFAIRRLSFSPNPPKNTDGRREESGRGGEGATGEIAWVPFGVGRSADGLHRRTGASMAVCGSCDARDGESAAGNSLGPGWRESAGIFGCPVGGSVADGAVRPGVEWLAAGPRRG